MQYCVCIVCIAALYLYCSTVSVVAVLLSVLQHCICISSTIVCIAALYLY